MAEPKERQHTRVGRDVSLSVDRKTEFYPGIEPPPPVQLADNRKIVGVMVSYSWVPGGKLFEVRQGRTHIGAGEIRGEGRLADVCCDLDELLSADHAMILVQGDNFYIQDLSSSNGTVLNGTPIRPEIPEPLPSPAEIKVGKTTFTFMRFDVAPGAPVARQEQEKEEKPPVRHPTVAPR